MFEVPPFETLLLEVLLSEQHPELGLHQFSAQIKGMADRFRTELFLDLSEDPLDVGLLDEEIVIEDVDSRAVGEDPKVSVRDHPVHLAKLPFRRAIELAVLDRGQPILDILGQHSPP